MLDDFFNDIEDIFDDFEREIHHHSDSVFIVVMTFIGVMLILGIIGLIINAKNDAKDNASPINQEMAYVISKNNDTINLNFETYIYILFETEKGERLKLLAKAQNLLAVGDFGLLTWQGRKVINFERKIDPKK